MKPITTRDRIRQIRIRWWEKYAPFSNHSKDKLEIYKRLQQLDLNICSAEDVNNIIGNSSWTRNLICSECEQDTDWVLRVGEEPDYESRTAYLCKSCVEKAAKYLS